MSRSILFKQFPLLETKRLLLRKLHLEDLPLLELLYNAPETQAYQTKHYYSRIDLMKYVLEQDQSFNEKSKIMWALIDKDKHNFIGTRVLYSDDGNSRN